MKAVAKRKVSKKTKSQGSQSLSDLSYTLEELQSIHDGLRTSTVSFTRDRLMRLVELLKAQQESGPK